MMTDQVDIDDVIDIVASDEKLFRYIMKLVKNRLPKHSRKDKEWCTKVIDLSIQSALQEIRVVDIVKNIVEQQRQQQEDEFDDDILLPQVSSDSDDDVRQQNVVTPVDEDIVLYHEKDRPTESHAIEQSHEEEPSSASQLNNSNSNVDDDSALRPHFSDNEPSTVSVNSPKRVLRNLNKYKNLPDSQHAEPSEEIEPMVHLEIETENLNNYNNYNTDNNDVDVSTESCAESEASTVQVTLPSPKIHSGLQNDDWEDEGRGNSYQQHNRLKEARASLSYDSDVDNDQEFLHADGEGEEEETPTIHTINLSQSQSRRYAEDYNVHSSSNTNESDKQQQEDISIRSSSDPVVKTHRTLSKEEEEEENDAVLMNDSARQSQEVFENKNLKSYSNSDDDADDDGVNRDIESPSPNLENNDVNDDLIAWERKVLENIQNDRYEDSSDINIREKDDDKNKDENDEVRTEKSDEEDRDEIFVVQSPQSLRVEINHLSQQQLSASAASTHSPSAMVSSPSTASPDRLKTRVPNRNILVHQTSPSNPGGYYSDATNVSPHQKQPPVRHEEEVSEEYSFNDFAVETSHLSQSHHQEDEQLTTREPDTTNKPHHLAENDEGDDYVDEFEDEIEEDIGFTVEESPKKYTTNYSSPAPAEKRGKKRVVFSDNVVSDIFYRDKLDAAEKRLLFYAHEDEWRFGEDQSREMAEAEKLGLTWAEWVEKYHHDHDDGLGNYGKRSANNNFRSTFSSNNDYTSGNRKMDLYTSGDDEFEMAEEDSDGDLYDFDKDF